MTEPEAAGRRIGDEDAVIDGPAKRLADLVLGPRRDRAKQRVADVAPRRRGQAQEALRRGVEPRHAL